MHLCLCYETILRFESTLPDTSLVVVELIGSQKWKTVLVMLNEKTVENSNGRMLLRLIRQLSGGAISSVASFHLSSRLWIPHQVIGCKLSSQQQTLKNLIKFWKEQCKHLQVQWSCYHGHNGECTACTKRTAQASFRHKKEQCKHLQDKISFLRMQKNV